MQKPTRACRQSESGKRVPPCVCTLRTSYNVSNPFPRLAPCARPHPAANLISSFAGLSECWPSDVSYPDAHSPLQTPSREGASAHLDVWAGFEYRWDSSLGRDGESTMLLQSPETDHGILPQNQSLPDSGIGDVQSCHPAMSRQTAALILLREREIGTPA